MFKTEVTVETKASAERIWARLADVEAWPTWNRGLKAARLEGPLVAGARGSVTLPNGAVRPFVVWEATPLRSLRYGTSDLGNEVSFTYRVDESTVTAGATIRGWLSPLLGVLFGRVIAGYLPDTTRSLARE